jgi:ubiquinol-cytochrome c reductase cytochrome b subunit
VHFIQGTTPLQRQGAVVLQEKQCRNCHQIGGQGGQRGPSLDAVSSHLTYDQLVRQVTQGGGNRPAYGKTLSPAQVTALVAFLETLHPPNQPIAYDASRHVAETNNPMPKEPVESLRP